MMSTTPLKFNRIVFIHGVGLRAAAWDAVRNYLKELNTTAIDLPGHGDSALPPMTSLSQGAKSIAETFDKPTLVVGHSLGALIALHMTAHRFANIAGAILVNPIYQREGAAKNAVIKRYQALTSEDNDPNPTLDRWYNDNYTHERALTKDWLLTNGEGYQTAYKVFAEYQDEPIKKLKEIQQPLLIIASENDPNSTPKMAENLAASITTARLSTLPNTAHMAIMTHPDLVANTIKSWIKDCTHEH